MDLEHSSVRVMAKSQNVKVDFWTSEGCEETGVSEKIERDS